MNDRVEDKPKVGLLGRLFGRRPAPEPIAEPLFAPVVEMPAAPVLEAPPAPLVEEPVSPVVDALAPPVVETPTAPVFEAPEPRVAEPPAAPVVEEWAPPVAETSDAAFAEEPAAPKAGLINRLFGILAAPAPPPIVDEPTESVVEPPLEPDAPPPEPKRSWLSRLTSGLARSSSAIGRGIVDIFTKRKLDGASLDDLEDILIQADLGIGAATRIREAIAKGRYEKGIDPDEVKSLLADEVERTLTPIARPLIVPSGVKPFVILVIGVNGSGKTTTIGKLAAKFIAEGRKVMLAAGDTFRAAAIEQLNIWAGRVGAEIVAREQGGDAAGLAFDALARAKVSGADILLIDTAGRLQNRAELMSELEKIIRVMKKVDPALPHATLLVLDATVGQNALSQVEIFGRVAGVTGLVMTKLDGTARGGILVAIADKFKLPVHFIGVGETVDDLEPFAARDFARAIAGIDAD